MDVGINYPFLDYGWDFGEAPPGWRGQVSPPPPPRWKNMLLNDLRRLQALGVKVVRCFILGDGLTYGIGPDAPRLTRPPRLEWRFDPPKLSDEFEGHFTEFLDIFATANRQPAPEIKLMPVFIDFLFCQDGMYARGIDDEVRQICVPDPGWVKQGRADAIRDERKRTAFLDGALEPLLEIAEKNRDVIYAWDIINEPEWVTNGWHPHELKNLPVHEKDMKKFIESAKERIRKRKFKPTIGFAAIETLRTSQITAEINQFHHYAGCDDKKRLPRHVFDAKYPGIIGEFATRPEDVWPELRPNPQTVLRRLQHAAAQGYPLAMPWSLHQQDQHGLWTEQVQRDIECFTKGTNCPKN